MSTVLDKIKSVAIAAKAAAETRYRDVVRKISAGKSVDAEAVVALLAECGRDAADLERDVQAMTRRLELARKLDAVPALEADLHSKRDAITTLERGLEEETARVRALVHPLDVEASTLTAKLAEAASIPAELERTCADENLRNRRKNVEARLARCQSARAEADDKLHRQRDTALSFARRAEVHPHDSQVAEQARNASAWLETYRQDLAKLNGEYDALVSERDAIAAEMRKP